MDLGSIPPLPQTAAFKEKGQPLPSKAVICGHCLLCELVWPRGKQRDLGSNLLRLSFLVTSCGLWTLSCDFVPHNYETLNWLSSLLTLMQKSF